MFSSPYRRFVVAVLTIVGVASCVYIVNHHPESASLLGIVAAFAGVVFMLLRSELQKLVTTTSEQMSKTRHDVKEELNSMGLNVQHMSNAMDEVERKTADCTAFPKTMEELSAIILLVVKSHTDAMSQKIESDCSAIATVSARKAIEDYVAEQKRLGNHLSG